MKSKAIDWTDNFDRLIVVCVLARFLDNLNIRFASDLGAEADDLHEEIFCQDCESDRGSCECNSEGRYMPEYDDGADYYD